MTPSLVPCSVFIGGVGTIAQIHGYKSINSSQSTTDIDMAYGNPPELAAFPRRLSTVLKDRWTAILTGELHLGVNKMPIMVADEA